MSLASKKAAVNIQKWSAMTGAEEEESEEEDPLPLQRPEPIRIPTIEEVNTLEVDLSINACLLCQRQFASLEKLRKHQAVSELHQGNMERYLTGKKEEAAKQEEEVRKWKDRAAQRRRAYRQPARPPKPPRQLAGPLALATKPPVIEQPTKTGIGKDNIGNQLLQKLGWKEGQGLGKDAAGIVEPVKAEAYSRGVGLGAGAKMEGGSGGSVSFEGYAGAAREAWRRRYEEER